MVLTPNRIICKRTDTDVAFTREYSRVSISTGNEKCAIPNLSNPDGLSLGKEGGSVGRECLRARQQGVQQLQLCNLVRFYSKLSESGHSHATNRGYYPQVCGERTARQPYLDFPLRGGLLGTNGAVTTRTPTAVPVGLNAILGR